MTRHPKISLTLALLAPILGIPAATAEDVVPAEKFLEVFGVPDDEMDRLISVEAAPKVAITIHFESDSAQISGAHNIEQLTQLGLALQSDKLKKRFFSIEGHTDKRGSTAYNLKLSQERSQAVVAYLKKEFAVQDANLDANGQGEYFLLDEGDSDGAHAKNRRVEIVLNGRVE